MMLVGMRCRLSPDIDPPASPEIELLCCEKEVEKKNERADKKEKEGEA
jgi:hypothetical protein